MSNLKGLLRRIGAWQSALLLSVMYVVAWIPVGWATILLGADWFRRRAPAGSAWRPRDPRVNDPRHVTEPF